MNRDLKLKVAEAILKGQKPDAYLLTKAIFQPVDEPVTVTMRDDQYFIQGHKIDPNKIQTHVRLFLPDNQKGLISTE